MYPDWFNRLLDANARLYRNHSLALTVFAILYIVGLAVSAIVLSLAVVGAAHTMSDPDYPALIAEFPWLEWAMLTAVELFSIGLRASRLIILGSLILAVYQWALKKGASGIKTERKVRK